MNRALVPASGLIAIALLAAGCGNTSQSAEVDGFAGDPPPPQVAPCNSSEYDTAKFSRVGDVIDYKKIEPAEYAPDPNKPLLTGANSYRVRYVSSISDNLDLRAVCGIVVLPTGEQGVKTFNTTPRIVSWSHGTVGLPTGCQPGQHPVTGLFGHMPSGIGSTVAGKKNPTAPETGALQTLVNAGKAVTASDYYSGLGTNSDYQPYMVARVAAANSIDLITAAQGLIDSERAAGSSSLQVQKPIQTILWGHSQGGATAMFAGQLWRAGYQPRKTAAGNPSAVLSGIALAAPAGNMVGQGEEIGLGDAIMHSLVNPLSQILPDEPESYRVLQQVADADPDDDLTEASVRFVPIAPILFTQISKGWDKIANAKPDEQQLPAFAPGTGPLNQEILSKKGAEAAQALSKLCVGLGDLEQIRRMFAALAPFYIGFNFFKRPFAGTRVAGPGVRRTCDNVKRPDEYTNWCKWLRWNTDGPQGSNPYADPPLLGNGDQRVPIFIAQGTNDQIVACQAEKLKQPDQTNPCMARALYTDLARKICPKDGSYSPSGSSLELDYFNKIGHLGVMAASSSNPNKPSEFTGSPISSFFDRAFDGKTVAGCKKIGPLTIESRTAPGLQIGDKPLVKNPVIAPRVSSPVITWDVAAHEDDHAVIVHLAGGTSPVSVPYGQGTIDVSKIPGALKFGLHNFTIQFSTPSNNTLTKFGSAYNLVRKDEVNAAPPSPTRKKLLNGSSFSASSTDYRYRDGTVTFRDDGSINITGRIDGDDTGVIEIKASKTKTHQITFYINDPVKPERLEIANLKIDMEDGTLSFGGIKKRKYPVALLKFE